MSNSARMKISKFIAGIILLLIGFESFPQVENKLLIQGFYSHVVYPSFIEFDYENNGSYKAGGTLAYYFSNRVSIGTGIQFEEIKYSVDYPPKDPPVLHLILEEYDYSYIVFPLFSDFDILQKRRHHLSLQPGFEMIALRSKEITFHYNDGHVRDKSDQFFADNVTHSAFLGASYRYSFFKDLFVGISPKIRYDLNDRFESTTFSFLFQLSIGYSIRFDSLIQ